MDELDTEKLEAVVRILKDAAGDRGFSFRFGELEIGFAPVGEDAPEVNTQAIGFDAASTEAVEDTEEMRRKKRYAALFPGQLPTLKSNVR